MKNEIRLIVDETAIESGAPSSDSWTLQEFNEEGIAVEDALVPWEYQLWFSPVDLQYGHSIQIGENPFWSSFLERLDSQSTDSSSLENDKGDSKWPTVEESEGIYGSLHPITFKDGEIGESSTKYQMLGYSDTVTNFEIRIKTSDDPHEAFFVTGSPGFSGDFGWTPAHLQINVLLSRERFNKLVAVIKAEGTDTVYIEFEGASGFYAFTRDAKGWLPADDPRHIKLLGSSEEEQKVIRPDDCEIEPPRLGSVGQLTIRITQNNANRESKTIEMNQPHDETDGGGSQNNNSNLLLEKNDELLAQLARNELILSRLLTASWVIVAVLVGAFLSLTF